MHSWPGKNEHVIRRNTLAMPMLLGKLSFMWFAKCLFHDHISYRIHLIFWSFPPGTQGPSWNWWILTLELWSCSLAMQPLGEDDLTCSSCMASCHKLFFCCCWGVFHFSSPEWWLLGLFAAEQLKSGFPLFFPARCCGFSSQILGNGRRSSEFNEISMKADDSCWGCFGRRTWYATSSILYIF